jgi:hypothetical protein
MRFSAARRAESQKIGTQRSAGKRQVCAKFEGRSDQLIPSEIDMLRESIQGKREPRRIQSTPTSAGPVFKASRQ